MNLTFTIGDLLLTEAGEGSNGVTEEETVVVAEAGVVVIIEESLLEEGEGELAMQEGAGETDEREKGQRTVTEW